MEEKSKKKKNCFIITPIGSEGSSIRRRVDQWEELVYEPAVGDEFNIVRADKIAAPGIINEQILDQIINAELVIIDFTDLNPNVMYETAMRHLARKAFIQIYPNTQSLPFDIQGLRSIAYDPEDLTYWEKLSQNIKKAYNSICEPHYKVPEVLPYKFDMEKIFQDPERFVELLKKHIYSGSSYSLATPQLNDNITEVYDGALGNYLPGLGMNAERITCPKCGIIQTFTRNMYGSLGVAIFGSSKHYKCNNCGTEFS